MSDTNRAMRPLHCFLDEAGDTTFYAKGRIPCIGNNGVSTHFILGAVRFHEPPDAIRDRIIALQQHVQQDPYYKDVPSIQKKVAKGNFYFHATDDPADVRKTFYDFIKSLDCTFEAVVAPKMLDIFEQRHNADDSEFYADILSHLLRHSLQYNDKLIFSIAQRGSSTKNTVLEIARQHAEQRFIQFNNIEAVKTDIRFTIQNQLNEPLLNVADYFCWALQRSIERNEMRYFNFLQEKISVIQYIYDPKNDEDIGNWEQEKLAIAKKG